MSLCLWDHTMLLVLLLSYLHERMFIPSPFQRLSGVAFRLVGQSACMYRMDACFEFSLISPASHVPDLAHVSLAAEDKPQQPDVVICNRVSGRPIK